LKVLLTPRAEKQLLELPEVAGRRVVRALRALSAAPRSGRRYPEDSPFRGSFYKVVVVRARRWSYRITYDFRGEALWVRYLYPAWYPLTHPDVAKLPEDDDG
jgi:mRNA-degrading endonuclease RelE of RelBE toxin-antitoxin system